MFGWNSDAFLLYILRPGKPLILHFNRFPYCNIIYSQEQCLTEICQWKNCLREFLNTKVF